MRTRSTRYKCIKETALLILIMARQTLLMCTQIADGRNVSRWGNAGVIRRSVKKMSLYICDSMKVPIYPFYVDCQWKKIPLILVVIGRNACNIGDHCSSSSEAMQTPSGRKSIQHCLMLKSSLKEPQCSIKPRFRKAGVECQSCCSY